MEFRQSPPLAWHVAAAAAALAAVLAAGTAAPGAPADALAPAAGEARVASLHAHGVQVYECRAEGGAAQRAAAGRRGAVGPDVLGATINRPPLSFLGHPLTESRL